MASFQDFIQRFGGQQLGAYNPFRAAPSYQSPYTPGAFGAPAAPGAPATQPPGGVLSGGAPAGGQAAGGAPGEGGRDNPAGLGVLGGGQGQSDAERAAEIMRRNTAVAPDPLAAMNLASHVVAPGIGTGLYIGNQLLGDPLGQGGINDAVRFTPEQQAAIQAQITANPQAAASILSQARDAYAQNQESFGWGSNPTQGAGLLSGGATTPSTPGMAVPAGSFPGVAQPVNPAGLQTLPGTGVLSTPAPATAAPAGVLSAPAPVSAADAAAARAAFAGSIPQGPERQAIMAAYDKSVANLSAGGNMTASALSQAAQLAKSGLGLQQGKSGVSGSQIAGGRTVGNNPNDRSGRNPGAPRDAGAGGRLGGGV